jgi:hypothetical protein
MWLEAVLSLEDLRSALTQLLPVTLELGSDGAAFAVGPPAEVSLVPGAGLRLVCPAQLTWPVLGIRVPVSLNSVSLVLSPKVEQKDGACVLAFEPSLEHADFAMVPEFVDAGLTDVINRELLKHKTDLSWNFAETLQTSFQLPKALLPRRTMSIYSHGAMVRVTEEAVILAISLRTTIESEPALPETTQDDDAASLAVSK